MKKICGIYKITSPSNSIYIGQSIDIALRWHHYKLGRSTKQILLHNSFKKYGVENHKFEVVEQCTHELLNEREKYYVDLYKTFNSDKGLNVRDGGGHKGKFKIRPENVLIKCLCGCGHEMLKYDNEWRERKYISGHNKPNNFLQQAIVKEIKNKNNTTAGLLKKHGKRTVKTVLNVMVRKGIIKRISHGKYELNGTTN